MQIVINLSEKTKQALQSFGIKRLRQDFLEEIGKAIAHGILLPERHGRLYILDENLMQRHLIPLDCSNSNWMSEVGIALSTVRIIPATEEKQIEKNCDNCKRNCRIFPSDGVCNHPDLYEPKQDLMKEGK